MNTTYENVNNSGKYQEVSVFKDAKLSFWN